MKCKYTIKIGMDCVEFEALSLSFEKCQQIKRIMEADKKVNGFVIEKLTYNHLGSFELKVYRPVLGVVTGDTSIYKNGEYIYL